MIAIRRAASAVFAVLDPRRSIPLDALAGDMPLGLILEATFGPAPRT